MTYRFKTLFLIALLQLALLLAPALVHAESLNEVVSPAVVKLTVRLNGMTTLIGSGFFIASDGSIVTNRHVVRNLVHEAGYTLDVTTSDRKTLESAKFEVGSCGENSAADLCEIRVPLTPSHFLSLSPHAPLAGDLAFALGHPRNQDFTLSTGKIKSVEFDAYESEEMRLTTALGPGSSGGPIVNAKGELIGVASKYSSTRNGENYALSFKEVRKFLATSSTFSPVAIARERISLAMQKRMKAIWKSQMIRKYPETVPHSFQFEDETLTVALPKIFDQCRELEQPDRQGAVIACASAGDSALFMLQRFDVQKSNPLITGRRLLAARPLDIATREPTLTAQLSPLEAKRLEAFDSRPLPAKCGLAKSGVFNHERACTFSVLNDSEPAAQSKNIWVQHGGRVYSFSAWMADSSQASFFNEIPAYVARTLKIQRTKNVAREATRKPVLMPYEWLRPEPLRLRSSLLSSSQDR